MRTELEQKLRDALSAIYEIARKQYPDPWGYWEHVETIAEQALNEADKPDGIMEQRSNAGV